MKFLSLVSVLFLFACSAKYMKVDNPDTMKPSDEFDRAVRIADESDPVPPVPEPVVKGKKGKKKPAPVVKKGKGTKVAPVVASTAHEPSDLEDPVGFVGRRPVKDPFWVGEKVVLDVSFFKISAGTLTLSVKPSVQVNGKKAYSLDSEIQTYPNFSKMIYAANYKVLTLLDHDQMIPRVFTLHVKDSKELREARSFFDFDKNMATYWEKKVTDKSGVEEKKQQWEILPFSQNVFSAIYYMRTFAWEDGKEYAFRVADDEQNLIFRGKVVRREILETDLGDMKAIVIKPEVILKGKFKPLGDIYIWLSDDDRKLVLRLETKISVGTFVAKIIQLDPGRAP